MKFAGIIPALITPYDANDPALRLWVFATLVDSILLVHDWFVRPLSLAEKQAYYQDSKKMARTLGVQADEMPPAYADFQNYVASMLDSQTLSVTPAARETVRALFAHPLLGLGLRVASFAGIGLLPEHLRDAYGLQWNERRERWLCRGAALARRARRITPDVFCIHPKAWLVARLHRA